MKCQFCEASKDRYTIKLQLDQSGEKLIWNSSNGTDALIFQTNYGVSPENHISDILKGLENVQLSNNKYFAVIDDFIWCRYVSAADKIRNGGCPINIKPATYSVFPCMIDESDNSLKIYANDNKGVLKSTCNLSVDFHADVERYTERKGLFKKEVDTGYYALDFGEKFSANYKDGDIVYEVSGIEIPITNDMLENRIVYVKSAQKPQIKSLNSGIHIV